MRKWWKHSIRCLLTGHDMHIKGEAGRMFLECYFCSFQSKGVQVCKPSEAVN